MSCKNIYPQQLCLKHSIEEGYVVSELDGKTLIDSRGAITLNISIDSCDYPKENVHEAVREICLKAVEYFD